jgi:predicted nuclease of predicted toxin-antitoxin system
VRIKLCENIGRRGADLLKASGHDVMTVRDQNLGGIGDQALFEGCGREQRVLITLNRDFGQILRFPPEKSAGIVVLDPGSRPTHAGLLAQVRSFLYVLESREPTGELWIIEPGRVRIHLGDTDE